MCLQVQRVFCSVSFYCWCFLLHFFISFIVIFSSSIPLWFFFCFYDFYLSNFLFYILFSWYRWGVLCFLEAQWGSSKQLIWIFSQANCRSPLITRKLFYSFAGIVCFFDFSCSFRSYIVVLAFEELVTSPTVFIDCLWEEKCLLGILRLYHTFSMNMLLQNSCFLLGVNSYDCMPSPNSTKPGYMLRVSCLLSLQQC